MVSEDKIYHQLRKEIDERMPLGMPSTDSGIEIELLKQIFTPEEAEVAIHLSALPESLKRIHKRVTKAGINISINELEKMYQKGSVNDFEYKSQSDELKFKLAEITERINNIRRVVASL